MNGLPSPAPSPPLGVTHLAIDTNVLLTHLPMVRALHARMIARDAWLLVPSTVITELDGLKNSIKPTSESRTLGDDARGATAWLLDQVRAQRRGGPGRLKVEKWSDADCAVPGGDRPDDSILACCLHFSAQSDVILWTNDRNLALTAEANGIPTVGNGVGFGMLCEAVGVIGVSETEGMEVDNDMDTDDYDYPLFSRRQRRTGLQAPHPNGTSSAPDPVTYSAELPPPGALRLALAEAAAQMRESPPTNCTPSLRAHHRDVAPTTTCPTTTCPTTTCPTTPRLSTPDMQRSRPGYDNCRPLPPQLYANLHTMLSSSHAAVCPGTTPPAHLANLAHALSGTLTDLVRDANAGVQVTRALALCADGARTLSAWLVPLPNSRCARSGEAADAVLVLMREMGGLGMPVDVGLWETTAALIRQT